MIKNADLQESFFTTPSALGASQSSENKWRRLGDGKGKGDFKGDYKEVERVRKERRVTEKEEVKIILATS